MKVRLEWKPQDLWIGAFWDKKPIVYLGRRDDGEWVASEQHVWICLLPMLPIHIWWRLT